MELKEYYDSYKHYKIKEGDNSTLLKILPKILTIVGKSCKPYEVEDLGQSLICKLCDRFKHWDEDKAQFNTYAYKVVNSNLPEYRLRLRIPVSMVGASCYLYEKLRKIYSTKTLEEFDNIQVEDLKLKIKLSNKTLNILKQMVKSDGNFYYYSDNYKDQDETDDISLIDERIDNNNAYKIVKKLIKRLSSEEQLLIDLYYFSKENESSYTKVANKINKSPQFVHKKIKVAINKIKNMYNEIEKGGH